MQTSMHNLTAHRFVSIWRPAWTFLLTFPTIFVASKAGDLAKRPVDVSSVNKTSYFFKRSSTTSLRDCGGQNRYFKPKP